MAFSKRLSVFFCPLNRLDDTFHIGKMRLEAQIEDIQCIELPIF